MQDSPFDTLTQYPEKITSIIDSKSVVRSLVPKLSSLKLAINTITEEILEAEIAQFFNTMYSIPLNGSLETVAKAMAKILRGQEEVYTFKLILGDMGFTILMGTNYLVVSESKDGVENAGFARKNY